LRFLQEKEIKRLGGLIELNTNRDLEKAVKEGAFMEDL